MAVSVKWVSKQRGGNHEPKFRPVNSDALDKTEKLIYRTTLDAIEAIPEDTYRRIIRGLISAEEVLDDLIARHLLTDTEEIAKAIFAAYVEGTRDMAHRLREGLNKELKRLGSDLRLVGKAEYKKATIIGMYEPWDWDKPSIPAVSLFDQQPDNMAGKVYARFRASEIISSITSDVQANIGLIIEEGFTAQQTFSTGRTVTGLTPEQTARRLYEVLQDVSPVPITTSQYAEYVAPHTNGLFPRWAKAVDRSMNTYANNLRNKGLDDKTVLERTTRHGQRYGNKLRRARARMIARTEVAFAQNRGMYDTLLHAQDQGIMGAQSLKEWTVGPTDVCPICRPMAGRKVPLKMPFNVGGNFVDYPPAHPNCRCFIFPVPQLSAAPVLIGSNVTGDPFRYVFNDGWSIDV
jgi:hypothetical protein